MVYFRKLNRSEIELFEYFLLGTACCVLVSLVASWDDWTSVGNKEAISRDDCSEGCFGGLVVDCRFMHEWLLLLGEFALFNHKWVGVRDRWNLLIKRVGKRLLYSLQIATSRRVSHNQDLIETGVLHIFLPYPRGVTHCIVVLWNNFPCSWVFVAVWVHDKKWNVLLTTFGDERQHRAEL